MTSSHIQSVANGVNLFLRATPGAGRNEITGIWRDAGGNARLSIKVSAPPEKGKANAAIVKLLARHLGLPKSAFSITAGETGKLKTVFVAGDLRSITERLNAIIGEADER